jgi:hypothetical protein
MIGMRAEWENNRVWPQEAMSEPFCWLCCADVSCIQKDLVTHLKLGGRSSLLIVVPCHIILGLCEGSTGLLKMDFM